MSPKPDQLEKTAPQEIRDPENEDYEFDANHSFSEAVYSEKWKEHRSDEYFQYRKMWDDVPRNKITTDFPIHLDIETTNICNLKCVDVPAHGNDQQRNVR